MDKDIIRIGREAIKIECDALSKLEGSLDESFVKTVKLLAGAKGKVIVTGIGKSGRIAEKMVSTLCSTGTPAVFLHAGEAVHGDLGIYNAGDPTIIISKSGSSAELLKLVPVLKGFESTLVGMLGNPDSPLAQQVDILLDVTVEKEADPLGIVPTTSAIATLAMGDAIASALMHINKFEESDFARRHPSGQLGRNLTLCVSDVMHPLSKVACVHADASLQEALISMTEFPLGAACITSADKLLGIITDGDLRRIFQKQSDIRDVKAADAMTTNPIGVPPKAALNDAIRLMEDRPSQISVLPVIDPENSALVGLIRIHDIYQPHLI